MIVRIGAEKPGRANNIRYALRSMCSWGRGPVGHLATDPTHGVKTYQSNEGPRTPEQLALAEQNYTSVLRGAYLLARYIGQRASDIFWLGWTDVDGETLSLRQKKTGVRPVCPIFPELAAEMRGWEKRPGPFLLQDSGKNAGKPLSTNQLWKVFDNYRWQHPELAGAVWHGLRANAITSPRRLGYTGLQIRDAIGLSVEMIEHYNRHEDKKAGAQTLLRDYRERKL